MFCLLVRASSSAGALDKRSGNEHHVIGSSFPTDQEEDEIILNEKNLRPEYSQTEDAAAYDDFRLQGILGNLRQSNCYKTTRDGSDGETVHDCADDCRCTECLKCERRV